jgi:hypothetical protein
MFVRFAVLTGAFLMVSATASIGESFTCIGDKCCYPDGKCFSRTPVIPKPNEFSRSRPAPDVGPADEGRAGSPSDTDTGRPIEGRRTPESRPIELEPAGGTSTGASGAGRPGGQGPAAGGGGRLPPGLETGSAAPGAGHPVGSPAGSPGSATPVPTSPRILETGYARLSKVGEEKPGYGLYSYVLITSYSDKSVALLNEIFKVVPNVQNTGSLPKQINILYIPFLKEKENEFAVAARSTTALGAKFVESFYDFQMARMVLAHLCNPPADVLRQLCGGDLSRGPFIFTYEKPASTFEPVQAPYLFVDLRDVNDRAFAEFVSAYQQQVKSEDVNSGERLNTLRLKFLNLTLNAADFVEPIPQALGDVIHSAKP